MVYDFEIFGQMTISTPSGPLILSYTIGEGDGIAHLSADVVGDVWPDAFGVKGLTVSWPRVYMSSQFDVYFIAADCRRS